jgi:hypothetical protein
MTSSTSGRLAGAHLVADEHQQRRLDQVVTARFGLGVEVPALLVEGQQSVHQQQVLGCRGCLVGID